MSYVAQPLSIEDKNYSYFITTRTANSRLWLIKNKELEEQLLAILARYQQLYSVILYAFILMGNHYHLIAKFPEGNRAAFMRDFNSAAARLIGRQVNVHGRRSVWARRYSHQVLLRPEDLTHWFYYAALNPVSSGIVKDNKEYPSFNSFYDAASGIQRVCKWIDWSAYILKKRYSESVKPQDFIKEYTLTFSKLPEFEELANEDYKTALMEKLAEREKSAVDERIKQGRGFLGKDKIKLQEIGATPRFSKISTRRSFRPLILTLCKETKRYYLSIYFSIREWFLKASKAFREGELSVEFPPGTYSPSRYT